MITKLSLLVLQDNRMEQRIDFKVKVDSEAIEAIKTLHDVDPVPTVLECIKGEIIKELPSVLAKIVFTPPEM